MVKLAPDLSDADLDDALEAILANKVDGVIATNTTLSRPDTLTSKMSLQSGGLSGAPLAVRSRRMVGRIYTCTQGKLPVIAAGGIMSPDDAQAAINAGASLVQIYTGLIFQGPQLVKAILQAE